jgi:prenyltransferase beta subunit
LLLLAFGCSSKPATTSEPPTVDAIDRALGRAGGYLAAQQSPDGAFRSHTYSALEDGWSLTPLATLALRMTPPEPPIRAGYLRGVAFVETIVDGGTVRGAPAVSYPEYAYALGALVLGAPDNVAVHRRSRDVLLVAIRKQQLRDGGWGYETGPTAASNLSATLFAAGALALAGTPVTDPALVAARGFVEHCQNQDGGFVFAPAIPDGNKAGPDGAGGFRSYGSMTADGVRLIVRLGGKLDDPKVMAGVGWLERNFEPQRNAGDFIAGDEVRRDSSYYYWAWSAAHALEHAGRPLLKTQRGDVRWAEALATELLRRQAADGSWRNPATEMREDDPLVATSFAIAALAVCRGVISGQRASHAGWN